MDGATAAATGSAGSAWSATRAITGAPTAIIALVSLSILLRFKVPEPILVSISGGRISAVASVAGLGT